MDESISTFPSNENGYSLELVIGNRYITTSPFRAHKLSEDGTRLEEVVGVGFGKTITYEVYDERFPENPYGFKRGED